MERRTSVAQKAHAGRVFLLMGKEYRISRSIRAQWFFQHLDKPVYPKPDNELISSREELEVLSVLPEETHCSNGDDEYFLVPSTKITFVGRQYRFVFCIDMSPSAATVDVDTGKVLVEEIYDNFSNCLHGLVEEFCVPGSTVCLEPDLFVTVLAHTTILSKTCQVLVQGYCATKDNVNNLINEVCVKLHGLEDFMAEELMRRYEQSLTSEAERGSRARGMPFYNPETSLFIMIRDGLLALQLLPDNASAGLVIMTDGVFGFSDASVVDAALAQMRANTVVCSFLQVGRGSQSTRHGFGYIAHSALMQFMATATSGAYVIACDKVVCRDERCNDEPDQSDLSTTKGMNMYHKALYCWNFQRDADRDKIDGRTLAEKSSFPKDPRGDIVRSTVDPCLSVGSRILPLQPLQRIKHSEVNLNTRISSVLSVRLREGYSIDGVAITKDGRQVEVKLILPWKEHVLIEYIAKAKWPLDKANHQTRVEVFIGGSYDFLIDVMRKPRISSNYRKLVVQKFEQTIKNLQVTDDLLVRIQSFSLNPVFYTIPESARKGVPLFYLPPNSVTPVLSLQHGKSRNSSVSKEAQFAVFWKPVLNLDTKIWQKWFHCHRISILLENDWPLSGKLFVPSGTDHYAIIQCRVSVSVLNKFLKDWCSFVLLENYSYIKFLTRPSEKEPYSFCILRLVFKGLSVVLRLAFVGGTAGIERQKVVSSLRKDLKTLKGPTSKYMFSPEVSPPESPSKDMDKLKCKLPEKSCITLLSKPLERILVKYESIPNTSIGDLDVKVSETGSQQRSGVVSPAVDRKEQITPKSSSALLSMLMPYMYNQRWIWNMSSDSVNSLSHGAIANILFHLLQLRLYEGYHICNSTNGIITVMKEITMHVEETSGIRKTECLVQYVLFPPHQQGGQRLPANEDSAESDMSQDNDGNLQMITEVWVEPQYGVVNEEDSRLSYLNECAYSDIPAKVLPEDLELVKDLVTYAHLENMCSDKVLISVPEERHPVPQMPSDYFLTPATIELPFPFNIPSLLRKSRQVLEFYPLLKEAEDNRQVKQGPNVLLLGYFHEALANLNDCTAFLTDSECSEVTKMLTDRCEPLLQTYKNSSIPLITTLPEDAEQNVQWQCYVKIVTGSLIFTVVPTAYDDIRRLNVTRGSKDLFNTSSDEATDEFGNHDRNSEGIISQSLPQDAQDQLILPVLVYQCEYASISKIPPMEYKFEDVIQDFTHTLSETFVAPSPDLKKSASSKTIGSFGKSTQLLSYCNSLYDKYFLTFVNSVFSALRKGYKLDNQDVESSVEMICEETYIEIDVSGLGKMLCSHWKTKTEEDLSQSVFEESQTKFCCRVGKRTSSGSTSTKSSKASSSTTAGCRNEAVQTFVKERFKKYVYQCFRPVPKNENLLYYSIELEKGNMEDEVHSDVSSDQGNEEFEGAVDDNVEATTIIEILNDRGNVSLAEDLSELSCRSIKGSTNSDLDEVENISADESEEDLEDHLKPLPLFMLLTCSVRDKSNVGSTITSFPISTLPTCLGDVIRNLEESGTSFNPYSPTLLVTLDLICLTLPQETDTSSSVKFDGRVPFLREESGESNTSEKSTHSEPEMLVQEFFALRKQQETPRTYFEGDEESSYIGTANLQMVDPLKNLPKYQQKAVRETVQKLEFLLEDEIASALRSVVPVTQSTLERVAKHILNSNADNCRSEYIPLRFVFGIEKSLQLFLDRLDQLQLDSYCLQKEGNYYYLSQNIQNSSCGTPMKSSSDSSAVKDVAYAEESSNPAENTVIKAQEVDVNVNKLQLPCDRRSTENAEQEELVNVSVAETTAEHGMFSTYNVERRFVDTGCDSEPPITGKDLSKGVDDIVMDTVNISDHSNDSNVLSSEFSSMSLSSDGMRENAASNVEERTVQEYSGQNTEGDNTMNQNIGDLYEEQRNRTKDDMDLVSLNEGSVIQESLLQHRRLKSEPAIKFSDFEIQPTSVSQHECSEQDWHVERRPDNDFWLILKLQNNGMTVLSQTRTMDSEEDDNRHEILYTKLVHTLEITCRIVNQIMLLDDLYDTMTCHNLLVAEEEEQIWAMNQDSSSVKPLFVTSNKQDVEMGMTFELTSVVHGEFEFKPGHFECDCVWNIHLPIHFRLKSSPGQQKGTSRGVQAVRAVLNRFAVTNRSNLFVFRQSTGNVFYFRIFESICVYDNVAPSTPSRPPVPDEDVVKEENLSVHSRASSVWSLSVRGCQDLQDDVELPDAKLKRTSSFANTADKDSVSELSLTGSSQATEETIHFHVYGICDPGKEIKEDLIKVLRSRLDDATLEQLNLLLARNPKCRLSAADVQFIQPPGRLPNSVLYFKIPGPVQAYIHPFVYYLRQNLLLKFHTPRYSEASTEYHFKSYFSDSSSLTGAEPIPANDVYLYNKRGTKGIGIGCIQLSLVSGDEQDVIAVPRYPFPRYEVCEPGLLWSLLNDMLELEDPTASCSRDGNEFYIRFRVWGRGDIGLADIETCVSTAIIHAICDVFMEYFILATPTGLVPQSLLNVHRLQSRSPSTGSQKASGLYLKGFQGIGSTQNLQTPVQQTTLNTYVGEQSIKVTKTLLSEPNTPGSHRSRSPVFPLIDKAVDSGRSSPDGDVFEDTTVPQKSHVLNTPPLAAASNETDESTVTCNPTDSPTQEQEVSRKSPLFEQVQASDKSTSRAGSPFDTLTDKEVEESLKAVSEQDIPGESKKNTKKESTWQEIELQRRRDSGKRKERRKYEVGDIGELHPCFSFEVQRILERLLTENYISLFKHEGTLDYSYAIDVVMKEVVKILSEHCLDIKPRVFRKINRIEDVIEDTITSTSVFLPFTDRVALKVDEKGESSLDFHRHQLSFVPGLASHYIVIGRNSSQWRTSVGICEELSDDEQESGKTAEELSKQRFKGLDPRSASMSVSKAPEGYPPSCVPIAFVPRQRIFFIELAGRKIFTYAYNFSADVTNSVELQLTRLFAWHNARGHLQSCLFMQKLGLFHHLNFMKGNHTDQETANFCSSVNHQHLIYLMKETSPPSRERAKAFETDTGKGPPNPQLPTFDVMFYDTSPPRLLHNAGYRFVKDVVKRSGHQYQEVRNVRLSVNALQSKLHEVFETWQQRGPHYPIYEDRLNLLKRQSRTVHFCNTPFLFKMPKEIMENELKKERMNDAEKTNAEKMNMANSSTRQLDTSQDWNDDDDTHDWFGELAWNFSQQYVKYLQTLGLCLIQVLASSKRENSAKVKGGSKRSIVLKSQEASKTSETRPRVLYLHKTSPGGILLLELEFKEFFFAVKIFGLESIRVKSLARTTSSQDTLTFMDECAKFKDYAHLHSFSYDFHLRQVQQFLAGRHSILYPGYPVNELLVRIQQEHPRPPHFSCCLLGEGSVSLPCTPGLATYEVYHYLTLNAKRHDLSVVKRKKNSMDTAADSLLSYMYTTNREHLQSETRKIPSAWRDGFDFDGTVVVAFGNTDDKEVINVHFFVLLTNRREFYPRLTLFGQTSSLKKTRKRATSGSDTGLAAPTEDFSQGGFVKPRVRFTTRTSSGSSDNLPEGDIATFVNTSGPIRVPTWPGSFPKEVTGYLKIDEKLATSGSETVLSTSQSSLPTTAAKSTAGRNSPNMSSLRRSESSDSESSYVGFYVERVSSQGTVNESYVPGDSKFIQDEITRVRGRLKDTVCSCLSNCWRDFIWYMILIGDNIDDESSGRKSKKKTEGRKESINSGVISGWELSRMLAIIRPDTIGSVTFSSMKLLIELVHIMSLEAIDATVRNAFSVLRAQQKRSILKTLVAKFTPFVRTFMSDDLQTTFLCILNPSHFDMFILVISDEKSLDVRVVYREKPMFNLTLGHPFDDLRIVDQADVRHVEEVVSCLCFTIWTRLIRT